MGEFVLSCHRWKVYKGSWTMYKEGNERKLLQPCTGNREGKGKEKKKKKPVYLCTDVYGGCIVSTNLCPIIISH